MLKMPSARVKVMRMNRPSRRRRLTSLLRGQTLRMMKMRMKRSLYEPSVAFLHIPHRVRKSPSKYNRRDFYLISFRYG